MAYREKVIEILEKAKTIIENWVPMFEQYNTPAGIDDAIALLKEQEEEIENLKQTMQSMMEGICLLKEQDAKGKWIYGEDETGVDGWHCSECGFFEPWFYEFTDDIDFIRFYGFCPSCGRRMTSYTGKPKQEGR